MRLPRSFVLFAALVGSGPAAAQDIPWKPYAEVTRGAEAAAGLFSVYYKRDQVLLGLTPEQFDRDYLLVTQLSQGIGELGLDGGTSLRSDLIRFHRQGDRVELWVVNPHFAATPGYADGAHGGLFLRPLGGAGLPDRDGSRVPGRVRSCSTSRRSCCRTGPTWARRCRPPSSGGS